MNVLNIDLTKTNGIIKPMNAVNNGPTAPSIRKSYTSFEAYAALNIPYARNHDASFFGGYGGEHTVDVHRIFKNFDADENDPANYIFEPTDNYVRVTYEAGTRVFYRLGASIEHGYKYGTKVPKDFAKWARICEHIIRHYNEGWADGFEYGIEYWEIWNEPECANSPTNHPCWQGTDEEFIELYCVAATHLKKCFPNLKIGGPAFAAPWPDCQLRNDFLDRVVRENIPLDFYSYHCYGKEIQHFEEAIKVAREELDKRGLTNVTTNLNEWNYIRGWNGEDWKYSLRSERSLKGSSFIAAVMSVAQALPLDMLMYYDARPCAMNGIFAPETYEPLKGYYSFVMFDNLAKLGKYAECDYSNNDIYACAATDGSDGAVMLTYYSDDDESENKMVELKIRANKQRSKAEVYILDEENDLKLVSYQYFTTDDFSLIFDMKIHSSVMVKIV